MDGIVGSQTWKALLPPTIRRSSNSHDVERLQITLNEMGYGSLVVDGIFGSNTEAAVKRFQKNMSLEVDGIVGSLTWYALMSNQINDC